MKKKLLIINALLFCVMSPLVSCDDQAVVAGDKNSQEVLFEVNYVNYAWGKQFRGLIIEANGQIKTYDKPAKWNTADDKKGLTLAQMEENLSNATLSIVTASKEDIEKLASKIPSIDNSSYTKPVNVGADQGATSFYAYKYDPAKMVFRPILLSQTGDWQTYNKDKSAIEISTWLAGISKDVFK